MRSTNLVAVIIRDPALLSIYELSYLNPQEIIMRLQTLPEWLSWLESLHPKAIDLGLDRVRTVGERLQIISPKVPVITVGGTNGKGSCVAFLSTIYQLAGYRTGVYTSPHLLQYNERVVINGEMASDDALIAAFCAVDNARGDISLTYFEFGTLAAFWLFSQQKLDLWVVEVGLGGRLDAVNIIDNDLAIIASIDLDHQDYLGDTIEAIGSEKAGIFRENRPAIIGGDKIPNSLIDHAKKINANLYTINKNFCYYINEGRTHWSFVSGNKTYQQLPPVQLKLSNAAVSIMAVELLQERLPVTFEVICKGLAQARVMGRFWRLLSNPQCIVDVAHNPAAANELARQLSLQPLTGKTVAVVGILHDKDIVGVLKALIPVIDNWVLATLTGPRGTSAAQLGAYLEQLGQDNYQLADSVAKAYQEAVNQIGVTDRIVVFGSFYTVAEVLAIDKRV